MDVEQVARHRPTACHDPPCSTRSRRPRIAACGAATPVDAVDGARRARPADLGADWSALVDPRRRPRWWPERGECRARGLAGGLRASGRAPARAPPASTTCLDTMAGARMARGRSRGARSVRRARRSPRWRGSSTPVSELSVAGLAPTRPGPRDLASRRSGSAQPQRPLDAPAATARSARRHAPRSARSARRGRSDCQAVDDLVERVDHTPSASPAR